MSIANIKRRLDNLDGGVNPEHDPFGGIDIIPVSVGESGPVRGAAIPHWRSEDVYRRVFASRSNGDPSAGYKSFVELAKSKAIDDDLPVDWRRFDVGSHKAAGRLFAELQDEYGQREAANR